MHQQRDIIGHPSAPEVLEKLPIKPADFGYAHNGASTLGFLRKIDATGDPLAGIEAGGGQEGDHFVTRDRYKILVRHLPARTFVDKLLDVYFQDFNWQYFAVNEAMLRGLLDQWYSLPFHVLSDAGPQGIDPNLRSFPALVLQMIATALLAIYSESDETFAPLKYAGNMTFEDLAVEYSETGVALLTLLGKRQMTLTTIIAGWVRAAFLKYTGQVTEAWHQIGTAIRDAQEIGLHRDQFDPQPDSNDSTESALEKMWTTEDRRRMWMILVGWDLHTGAVLGRPTSVDHRTFKRNLPVDCPIPRDRKKTLIFPRAENDPPTPLTRALFSYQAVQPLREILHLEKEGPFPKDFTKVEKLHQELVNLQERIPPVFRLESPDTRFDKHPDCGWLVNSRFTLPQVLSFNFMALHRPYIFTRANSRYEALKASLDMLQSHRLHFSTLKVHQYKTFSLFFGTFDGIVMMASIYILFPKENRQLLSSAMQHFQWGVERFEAMASRNRLANAALGVLNAIYIRLKKAVGMGFPDGRCPNTFGSHNVPFDGSPCKLTPAASNGSTTTTQTPASSEFSSSHHPSVASTSTTISNPQLSESRANITGPSSVTATGLTPTPETAGADLMSPSDWPFPTDFDFSSLPPMYPMGDVAYNDLTGTRNDTLLNTNAWAAVTPGEGANNITPVVDEEGEAPLQFGGDFGNDTIWNLLNQFPSY